MGINAVGQRILESLFCADSFEYWLILTLDQSQTCAEVNVIPVFVLVGETLVCDHSFKRYQRSTSMWY